MISISATPHDALELFRKLSSDDSFRAQLEKEPSAALAACNITVSNFPASVALPSKQMFLDALEKSNMQAAAGVTPQSPFYAFLAFFAFMV